MSLKQHFELMAEYNQWMNDKICATAGDVEQEDLIEDRGAFFGSILGTLNHIVVGDIIWLKRFAKHPAGSNALREISELPDPIGLDQILFEDFDRLREHREWLDRQIISWIAGLAVDDLGHILSYHNTKGVLARRRFSDLILHFFNHQTHHRGQISVLLSQAGKDIGVTDLLALIPDRVYV